MKQAVIDIGTNTVLLLIAESSEFGKIRVIDDVHSIARLGEGVDHNKLILPEAYQRLRKVLESNREKLSLHQVGNIVAIATSAMRDAENRDEIIANVRDEFGISIELLNGTDESVWSYRGAVCGLSRTELHGIDATLDIGGGSTELSIGKDGIYLQGKSINIGALRITERFLRSINAQSISIAREFIRSQLSESFSSFPKVQNLIAVAGTPTSLGAMQLQLPQFDAKQVNGAILTFNGVKTLNEELSKYTSQQLLEKYPAIPSSRADILPAGGLILEELMNYFQLENIRVSTYGLRYGIMIRAFEKSADKTSDEWLVITE